MEFSLAPLGATSFASAVKIGAETYQCLREALDEQSGDLGKSSLHFKRSRDTNRKIATNTTSTGTFYIPLLSPQEALHMLVQTIHTAGHTGSISISLSPSQSSTLTVPEKISLFQDLTTKFPITLLEDGISKDKCSSWSSFMSGIRSKGEMAVIDHDVLTQEEITGVGEQRACNGVLLKLRDFGSVIEIIEMYSSLPSNPIKHILTKKTELVMHSVAVSASSSHPLCQKQQIHS
jgi:enolase